jgi:hypothetical protein
LSESEKNIQSAEQPDTLSISVADGIGVGDVFGDGEREIGRMKKPYPIFPRITEEKFKEYLGKVKDAEERTVQG